MENRFVSDAGLVRRVQRYSLADVAVVRWLRDRWRWMRWFSWQRACLYAFGGVLFAAAVIWTARAIVDAILGGF